MQKVLFLEYFIEESCCAHKSLPYGLKELQLAFLTFISVNRLDFELCLRDLNTILFRRFRWNSKSIIDCCEKSPKFAHETPSNCIRYIFDCRWYVNGWTLSNMKNVHLSFLYAQLCHYMTTGAIIKVCTKYLPAIRKHLFFTHTHTLYLFHHFRYVCHIHHGNPWWTIQYK